MLFGIWLGVGLLGFVAVGLCSCVLDFYGGALWVTLLDFGVLVW